MSTDPHLDFSDAWRAYLAAVQKLWDAELDADSERPHLKSFETLAREALRLIGDVGVGAALQEEFLRLIATPREGGPARLYLLELTSFAAAVNAATPPPPDAKPDLLGHVSTIAGSAKEIFPNLHPWIKAGIHGFGEVAKLFKRK